MSSKISSLSLDFLSGVDGEGSYGPDDTGVGGGQDLTPEEEAESLDWVESAPEAEDALRLLSENRYLLGRCEAFKGWLNESSAEVERLGKEVDRLRMILEDHGIEVEDE